MIFQRYTLWLYLLGLLGIVAGMSLSKPAVSTGVIICGTVWLSELDFVNRIKRVVKHPLFIVSFGLMLLHLIGLCWSENISYGLKDIKTKLPLLVLPIVFSSSNAIRLNEHIRFIQSIFIGSLVACTALSFGIYFHWIKPEQFNPLDMRTMIFGVSGVRLALYISLAFCMLAYDAIVSRNTLYRILCLLLIGWFIYFLNFIESGTGLLLGAILLVFGFVYAVTTNLPKKIAVYVLTTSGVLVLVGVWLVYGYIAALMQEKPDPVTATHTKYGELYITDTRLPIRENGYIVGENVAPVELEAAWNTRSAMPYSGVDKLNQPLYATLLRYLNSKGMAKDREAIEKLTDTDIRTIENGIANIEYTRVSGWKKRLLQLLYEIESYQKGQDPFGNSMTQRFEYWRLGSQIWLENLFTGVGTGDVREAFDAKYRAYPFYVMRKNRLRAHNQYLTMAVAFGVPGLFLFLIYCTGIIWSKAYTQHRFYALSFLLIMLISFLSEDTLETQSGVTFVAIFQCLFMVGSHKKNKEL